MSVRIRWWLLSFVLVVLLGSCGGADATGSRAADRPTDRAEQPQSPTPTPERPTTNGPTATPTSRSADADETGDTDDAGDRDGAAASVVDPVEIAIPAIGVRAELVELELLPDGAMETPDYDVNQAGWYVEGPRPGETGPAVIAGHVDSRTGPDVFYRLRDLTAGDEVVVTDAEGATHSFVVERLEQHDKDGLPYREIWGPTTEPTLRLITCAGPYDTAAGAYRQNLIVYAG